MTVVEVKATVDIYGTMEPIQRRKKGETFSCPVWLAKELSNMGKVDIVGTLPAKAIPVPKEQGASVAGPVEQLASSSPVDQVSPSSKSTTSSKPTPRAGARRSR